jgi:hypothetical protein
LTKRGVTPEPKIVLIGNDNPRIAVARCLSRFPNHWWLILVGRQAMNGAPIPVKACPDTVSQYQTEGLLKSRRPVCLEWFLGKVNLQNSYWIFKKDNVHIQQNE